MGDVTVIPFVDEGLGNSAYLLDLDDGRALAVDVSRDLRQVRELAERRGLKIAHAADTHLHADFLTRAVQPAASEGAEVLASAEGRRDPAEIPWQARRVGYDQIAGELRGGIDSWRAAGEPATSIPVVGPNEVGHTPVLDIRHDNEFDAGHVPGARHIELGALPAKAAEVPEGPTVVMCGHSERAMGAASLLARAGRSDISVLDGGPQDWAEATGESLDVGA